MIDLETERYFRQNEIVITGQLANIQLISSAGQEDLDDEDDEQVKIHPEDELLGSRKRNDNLCRAQGRRH